MADQQPLNDPQDSSRPLPSLQDAELRRLRGGKAFPPGFDPQAIARRARQRSRQRRRLLRGGGLGLLTAALLFVAFDPSLMADYSAPVGQVERIALPNGVHAQLDSGTAMSWSETEAESRVRLHEGVVVFETTADAERDFVVEVGALEVRPIGTVFAVSARDPVGDPVGDPLEDSTGSSTDGSGWSALVESGQVRVTQSHSGASRVIGPNEAASVDVESGQLTRAAIDVERTLAWRNGILDFKNASLTEVVRTLERYRPGRILLLNEEAAQQRFDGVLALDDIDEALRIVAESSGLELLGTWPLLVILR